METNKESPKHTKEQLKELQARDIDYKIHHAEAMILEFYHIMNGKVYVSFSGGKDSTVLLHLVRSILPNVEACYFSTGLEFPEIEQFVRTFDNVSIRKPKMNFREVINKYGYPIVSKAVCSSVVGAKRNPNSHRADLFTDKYAGSIYSLKHWEKLLTASFECNDKCCEIMKKRPSHAFTKETGKAPIIGTTAEESRLRQDKWIKYGCNSFTKGHENSNPLSIWLEKDIKEYVARNNITLAKPYQMGYTRTGCVFCAFGAHLDGYPNRFQMLQRTHPNLYEYMMKPKSEGGLGFKEPLEYIGVPIRDNQMNMFDYLNEKGELKDVK